jgi:hypothetical protein
MNEGERDPIAAVDGGRAEGEDVVQGPQRLAPNIAVR